MAKEAAKNSPKKTRAKAPAASKKVKANGGMKPGASEMYLKVTKAVPHPVAKEKEGSTMMRSPQRAREPEKEAQSARLPPVFLAPSLEGFAGFQPPLPQSAESAAEGGEKPYLRPRREYWKSPPPHCRTATKPSFPANTTSTLPISAFFTACKSTQPDLEVSTKRTRQPSPPLTAHPAQHEHQPKYRAQEPLQRSLSALEPEPQDEEDLASDEDTLPPLSTMFGKIKPKREKGLRRSCSEADAVPSDSDSKLNGTDKNSRKKARQTGQLTSDADISDLDLAREY